MVLAEKLGLWDLIPPKSWCEANASIAGHMRVYVLRKAIDVCLVDEDLETEPIIANAIMVEERRGLISD